MASGSGPSGAEVAISGSGSPAGHPILADLGIFNLSSSSSPGSKTKVIFDLKISKIGF